MIVGKRSKTYRKVIGAIAQWKADAEAGKRGIYDANEIEKHYAYMMSDPGAYDSILEDFGITEKDLNRFYKRK